MKKKPALKFIPYMWYTDNNNNYLPPVNLSNVLKGSLDSVSLGVERTSSATVWDKYGFKAQLPANATVPLPRIDYLPLKGTQSETPDYLFEDEVTNHIGDLGGTNGSGYNRAENPTSSTSLDFLGLVDPTGKQFAVAYFWKGGSVVNTAIDQAITQTPSGSFDAASPFALSAYIKQNSTASYARGSSFDEKRLISARYFAMRIKSNNNRIIGWVWDWEKKVISSITSHSQSVELIVEKAPNGWYRCGLQGIDNTKGETWTVEYGYVEPDANFSTGYRFGPDTQYSLSGLWWGLQLETGNINGNITSLIWSQATNTNLNTRTVELVNSRGHSNVEQFFEATTNGAILFFRFKYPHLKGIQSGDAKVGISKFNADTGTNANFMGFAIGSDKQLRGLVRRNNSNTAFFSKAKDANDFYITNEFGGQTPKYISVALVYNRRYTEFYVNGVKIGNTDTDAEPPNWEGNNFQLGITFRSEFTKERFFGRVNEFSIYHTNGIAFSEQSEFAKKLTENKNPLKG